MNSPMGAFSFLGQDASVLKKKVKPGTARRTLAFAVPYSGLLALFLLIVILGAGISIASPLIYRQIINDGIHLSAVVGSRMVLSLRAQLFRISSRCRSRFSPVHRPAPWSIGSIPKPSVPS